MKPIGEPKPCHPLHSNHHSSRRARFAPDHPIQNDTFFDHEFGNLDDESSSSLNDTPDQLTVNANIQGVVGRDDSMSHGNTIRELEIPCGYNKGLVGRGDNACVNQLVPLNMAESYLLAFTNDSSAISKLFLTKHFFHQAYVSCGFFQQTEPDVFSNHLVGKFTSA